MKKKKQGDKEIVRCSRCLKIHKFGNCPAFGKKCNKCKRLNHFAIVCKSKDIQVNTLSRDNDDGSDSGGEFALAYSIKSHGKKNIWIQDVQIENSFVKFKLDTGSDANIIPVSTVQGIIGNPMLKPTRTTLQTYSGHRIFPLGEIVLHCVSNGNRSDEVFLVVEDGYKPILSRDSCVKLGLIKRVFNVEGKSD